MHGRIWLVAAVCGAFLLCADGARAGEGRNVPEAVEQAEALGKAVNWASSQARDSVVRVSSKREISIRPPTMPDDIRRRLQRQLPRGRTIPRELGETRNITRRWSGSGIILDTKGHILTCNHVLSGAEEITVTTADGQSLNATVVGTDEFTDTAVIKVEADGLKPSTLGDSEDLYVGQPVVTIGWPDGLDSAVSFGVVSALHQRFGAAPLEDFVRFDADVANGAAGGALINLRGEVVGLVAARMDGGAVATSVEQPVGPGQGASSPGFPAPSGGAMGGPVPQGGSGGPGFAIPIDVVEDILDMLKAGKPVERGFLGIYGKLITADIAKDLGYDSRVGTAVEKVMDGSPAEKAGLQKDDVIVSANGKELDNFQQLRMMLARAKPGDVFTLKVWREGNRRTIEVELGERPTR